MLRARVSLAVCASLALFAGCATLLGLDEDRQLGSVTGGGGAGGQAVGGAGGAPCDGETYAEVVMCDGPRTYYRFEEESGDFLNEVAGGPTAVLMGNVSHVASAGAVDAAARFSDDGYLEIGDYFPFLGLAPMSLELWASVDVPVPATANPPFQYLISKRIPGGEDPAGYSMSLEPDSILRFSRVADDQFPHAKKPLSLGVFVHVVGTFDGDKSILYFDGEEVDRNSDASNVELPPVGDLLVIGGADTSVRLHGMVDEVAIYDYALPLARIEAHFHAKPR